MADIHGIPSESMMIPVQSFTSEPLPDIQPAFDQSVGAAGAGVLYPVSDRQRETLAILESPAGATSSDVLSGDGTLGFPTNLTPPADADNGGYGGA